MAGYMGLGMMQGFNQQVRRNRKQRIAKQQREHKQASRDLLDEERRNRIRAQNRQYQAGLEQAAAAKQHAAEERQRAAEAKQQAAQQRKALAGYRYTGLLTETQDPQAANAEYQHLYGEPFSHPLDYDAQSGQVTLPATSGMGGAQVDLGKMHAHYAKLAGIDMKPADTPEPADWHKFNDRLLYNDQGTFKAVPESLRPPPAAGENGLDMSPYNKQRTYGDIEGNIASRLGGDYDSATGKYTVPAGQGERFAVATDWAEDFEKDDPARLAPATLSRMAMRAIRGFVPRKEAEQQAEKQAAEKDPFIGDAPWEKQGITKAQWIKTTADDIYTQSLAKAHRRFMDAIAVHRRPTASRRTSPKTGRTTGLADANNNAKGIPSKPDKSQAKLPPQALAQLKKAPAGSAIHFNNGQVWTLKNGQPVRVK